MKAPGGLAGACVEVATRTAGPAKPDPPEPWQLLGVWYVGWPRPRSAASGSLVDHSASQGFGASCARARPAVGSHKGG